MLSMADIKTKESIHDIKVLDRSKVVAEHMKKSLIRTKDTAQNLMDDGQVTPEEYASDQTKYMGLRRFQNASRKPWSRDCRFYSGGIWPRFKANANQQCKQVGALHPKHFPSRKACQHKCIEDRRRAIS